MTFHLVSLPWTEATHKYSVCAYTQKVVKFCKMFSDDIILYAGEDNDAPCREHVQLISKEEREGWFGPWDTNTFADKVTWDIKHPAWQIMNSRAAQEIQKRRQPHDMLLIIGGNCQKPIADAISNIMTVEWGIGYEGIFSKFCAFESYAWMHHVYGLSNWKNGRYYDQVIPNFFDMDDFQLAHKEDYLLFIGRITQRKGPHVASQIAQAAGKRLLVAGPGATSTTVNGYTKIVGDQIVIEGSHIEYVGPVNPKERSLLMAKAAATIVPTIYLEPFGGVAVESMLCGTPVIASDWGAFPETVHTGISGERFRTLQQGVDAVELVQRLKAKNIRKWARSRYSLEAVKPMYGKWFDQLEGLWGPGWNALRSAGIESA